MKEKQSKKQSRQNVYIKIPIKHISIKASFDADHFDNAIPMIGVEYKNGFVHLTADTGKGRTRGKIKILKKF